MAHAIRFEKAGGPEVLSWQEVPVGKPGQGQVRLRHSAVGLNYIDTYHRSGLYALPMPAGLGSEAAGVVTALGANVGTLKVGDRVAYCMVRGAYAEAANIPAWTAVKLPANIADDVTAAALLKGLTARYLLKATYRVKPGETIL